MHTGKAVKATVKEGPGNIDGANAIIRNRTPDTMAAYHNALDDLESEIVRLLLLATPLPKIMTY